MSEPFETLPGKPVYSVNAAAAIAGVDVRTLLSRIERGGLVPEFRNAKSNTLMFSEEQVRDIVNEFKKAKQQN